jgi:hypothetical protein
MNLAFDIYPAATPLSGLLVRLTNQQLKKGSGFRVELAGVGAGRIAINQYQAEATAANFAQDNFVHVLDLDISESIPLGGWFLAGGDFKLLSPQGQGDQLLTFYGPGALSYFGRAVLAKQSYTGIPADGGPHADGLYHWYGPGPSDPVEQYGDILRRLIREAQAVARPQQPLSDLTYDFDSTDDSAGAPWEGFTGEYTLPIGINYLDVVQRFRDLGLTIQMSGDLLLQAFQGFYGSDRTGTVFADGTVRFVNIDGAPGANIVEDLTRRSQPSLPYSQIDVKGDLPDPDAIVSVEAVSYNVVREGFVQADNTHAVEALTDIADQALQLRLDSSDVPIFRHIPGLDALNGLYTPFPPLGGSAVSLETSTSWKMGPLNTHVAGWRSAGFDDSGYPNAVNVSSGAWYDNGSPRWIWNASGGSSDEGFRDFRKEITLTEIPLVAHVTLAADGLESVYVNGTLAASHTGYASTGIYAIDPSLFVVGANCISVEVTNPDAPGTNPGGGYMILALDSSAGYTYWVGDLVTIATGIKLGDYDNVALRVYAINWRLDEQGNWWPVPELGGLIKARTDIGTPPASLSSISGGTGGGVVTSASQKPYSLVRQLTNKSGAAVVLGDVVVIDPDNNESFETTTTAAETRLIGIALGNIAANAKGPVAIGGYVELVNVVSSVTRGHYGFTSTTVKKASSAASRGAGAFCEFLKGGTTPSAMLFGVPDATAASEISHSDLLDLDANDHPQYRLVTDGGQDVINVVMASGSTETLDLADGNVHDVTLTANCTISLAGAVAGVACYMSVLLRQDGTGSRTVTWPASVEWVGGAAPTLQTVANAWDWVQLVSLDGGTVWFAAHGGTGGATDLDDLTDVVITSPSSGQLLRYNGSSWVNATPGSVGPLLISDSPSTPLVFADLIQNEAQDDLVYADT